MNDFIVHPDTGEVLRFRLPWMRVAFKTEIVGDSMTHQSHAESCDINRIVAAYTRSGEELIPDPNAVYDDVTGLQGDFTEMVNESWRNQKMFMDRVAAEKAEKEAQADAQRKKDAEDLARYRSQDAGTAGKEATGSSQAEAT